MRLVCQLAAGGRAAITIKCKVGCVSAEARVKTGVLKKRVTVAAPATCRDKLMCSPAKTGCREGCRNFILPYPRHNEC